MKTEKQNNAKRQVPDVQTRLEEFVASALVVAGSLPEDKTGNLISDLLTEQALAAFYAHGEAEGSVSAKAFADKFRQALVSLRKFRRTIALLRVTAIPCNGEAVRTLEEEADILVRIFFSSLRTLEGATNQ